jgi:hypothetical protein
VRDLPRRRKKELIEAVPHVAYERVALDVAVEDFLKRSGRRFDLEAALVHARSLTDFFWRRTNHSDGVYALHYDEGWAPGRHGQLPRMRYEAMSAQLAHISTKRSTSAKDLTREVPAIAADLLTVWDRWRTSLDGTEWGLLVDKWVKHWQDEVKKSRAKGRPKRSRGRCARMWVMLGTETVRRLDLNPRTAGPFSLSKS